MEYSLLIIRAKVSTRKTNDIVSQQRLLLVAESFRSSPIRSVLTLVKVARFNIDRVHGLVFVVTRRTRNNVNETMQRNPKNMFLSPIWTS